VTVVSASRSNASAAGRRDARRRSGGQVLVIFALALTAIVAMTGLVIDGGSTFVQRRDQQNVADAAAMAAGYSYSMGQGTGGASTAARSAASSNGYSGAANGATVTITNAAGSPGWYFTATVTRPHNNAFSGLLGMPSWMVTTTATVITGRPNAAIGAMPIIFNEKAFHADGGQAEVTFHEPDPGSQDVPVDADKFNWTMYCNNCNADSNTVRDMIDNNGLIQEADVTWKLSPLNAGSHATLYDALAGHLGEDFPVPIVDDNGDMVGWATFHLTGSVGGSTKTISGYFKSPVNHKNLKIVQNGVDGCDCGDWSVYLTN
jgi:Flp pilus assembly protein TadG